MENTYKKLMNDFSFASPFEKDLWAKITSSKDSLSEERLAMNPLQRKNSTDLPQFFSDNLKNLSYLPIEYFRTHSEKFFQNPQVHKTFLSSGTTNSTRSKSCFSKTGDNLYHCTTVKVFMDVLKIFFPENWETIQGYSLIPRKIDLPQSSLAQMVDWLSNYLPLEYIDAKKTHPINNHQPVWIFATAFDIINAYDAGINHKVHPRSVVIETGGTKGKSRSVEKSELSRIITKVFGVSKNRIISEYGMGELACQAYNFIDPTKDKLTGFRFPFWVDIFVTDGFDYFYKTGQGSLVVYDPIRIDYPWPIRIQDIVELSNDTFIFLQRSPKAPLKGCSLNSEELELNIKNKSNIVVQKGGISHNSRDITKKFTVLSQTIRKLLENESYINALTREFNSQAIAKLSINDLEHDLPKSSEEWLKCIEKSELNEIKNPLIILPKNHSIVAFYPVIICYLLNKSMTIRIPKGHQKTDSALNLFLKEMVDISDNTITTVDHNYRTDGKNVQFADSIICYGEDHTVELIKKQNKLPTIGFGTGITISFIDSEIEFDYEKLVKDVFSLAQRGCRSSRIVLMGPNNNFDSDDFYSAYKKSIGGPLSVEDRVSLDYETLRLRNLDESKLLRKDINSPLLSIYSRSNLTHPHNFIPNTPYVLPIFLYDNYEQLIDDILKFPQISTVSTNNPKILATCLNKSHSSFKICPLGKSNLEKW